MHDNVRNLYILMYDVHDMFDALNDIVKNMMIA